MACGGAFAESFSQTNLDKPVLGEQVDFRCMRTSSTFAVDVQITGPALTTENLPGTTGPANSMITDYEQAVPSLANGDSQDYDYDFEECRAV